MPKGRKAQEKVWACGDCKHNNSMVSPPISPGGPRQIFECLHSDARVNMATSDEVLATCDSWEAIVVSGEKCN